MKFSTMFKPMVRIPSPPIFQRVDKIYNSSLVGMETYSSLKTKYVPYIDV